MAITHQTECFQRMLVKPHLLQFLAQKIQPCPLAVRKQTQFSDYFTNPLRQSQLMTTQNLIEQEWRMLHPVGENLIKDL